MSCSERYFHPTVHPYNAYPCSEIHMRWLNPQAIIDRGLRTHGPGAARRQGNGPGGSPICCCACVWCSWWVDWSLGRAIGFLHQTMVVNFKYINTDWQPRRASGRGTKKAQNTSTSPILLAYVLDNALRYPKAICRVSGASASAICRVSPAAPQTRYIGFQLRVKGQLQNVFN